MPTHTFLRRAGATLVASALALAVIGAGDVAQAAPADRGAGWLAGQPTDGVIVTSGFPDYGLSIDTAIALQAIGGQKAEVRKIRDAVAANLGDYITGDSFGDPGSRYAGATAKSLVLAQTTGGDPTDFGGVNLVKRLKNLIDEEGPAVGRISDLSMFGDFANTIGQILTVRGLTTAKSGQAGPTRRFLLQQQCRQGYFRLNFSKAGSAHQSCGKNSPADPDTTSYAVIELWKVSQGNAKLRGALTKAVAWLEEKQRKNGSLVGGTSTATPNTNSTGLAAWAFGLTGNCSEAKAAAAYVAGFQVGPQKPGSKLAGQRGAIAYDGKALKAGTKHGINSDTQDQWRRATSQAAPSLLFRHGC
jgi:hypothetical protein